MFEKQFLNRLNQKIFGETSELDSSHGNFEKQERLQQLKNEINQNNLLWDVPVNEAITSQRKVVGKFIVFGKKVVRKLLFWLVTRPLLQQREFNGSVTRSLNEVYNNLHKIGDQEEMQRLYKLLKDQNTLIEKQLKKMNEPNEELQMLVQNLAEEIRILKKQDSFPINYKKFEDRFRGEETFIQEQQINTYYPYLEGKHALLDLGCGRGEFIFELNQRGMQVTGVDISAEMIQAAEAKKLDVYKEDILEFLRNNKKRRYDAITCFHVIEHLYAYQIVDLVNSSYEHLNEGGLAVFETPNPECLYNFAYSLTIDMSHKKAVHAHTMKFIMEEAGFTDIRIIHLAPVDSNLSLFIEEDHSIISANFEKINRLLFSYQNYAIIGRK